MNKKNYICGLLPLELKKIISEFNLPVFRVNQLLDWIYKKGVYSFLQMSNLSKSLRQILEEKMTPVSLSQEKKQVSRDKTVKYAFKTYDGQIIESVFIPSAKRATVCISTQAGCAFGCIFCASGIGGLNRNLSVDEIVSQVLWVKKDNSPTPVTNIVLMGMGEPLANYENTLRAVRILNNPECLGIAARKITISTCGLPKEIMRLAKEGIQIELSISLHAGRDDLRDRLMPINKIHPLSQVMKTAKEYTQLTGRIITFEYALIKGVNDSTENAQSLANMLSGYKCKVNFITLNEIKDKQLFTSSPAEIEVFKKILDKRKINYTFRKKRGADIQAACGQLRIGYRA